MYKCALHITHIHSCSIPNFCPLVIAHFSTNMRMSSLSKPEYLNQQFLVDMDGNQVTDLVFASEPIGMATFEGYGWPQFEFGEWIGPED
jgi:hypothetical protein